MKPDSAQNKEKKKVAISKNYEVINTQADTERQTTHVAMLTTEN